MSVDDLKIAARRVSSLSLNYMSFAWAELRPLSIGISFALLSSFGQTFFLSLFVPYFQEVFGLTEATYGTMYSAATLGSALTIPYAGAWIDRMSLKRYGLLVLGGLALASATVALSYHIAVLFLALYLLRLTGQGLSSHTARTAMARRYTGGRGRALSIANLGYPMGEGTLPLLFTMFLGYVSWRMAWWSITGSLLLLFIPLMGVLLRYDANQKTTNCERTDRDSQSASNSSTSYTSLLTESRFWFIVPSVVLPGFWATGLLLYQVQLGQQFHWSKQLMASAFVGFAVGRILFSLTVGPLIDLFTARRLFPFYLIPLGLGFLAAYFHSGNWSVFVYLGCMGMTLGAGSNLKSALFAELYGTSILGTVRSLFKSFTVASTALCPTIMGWVLYVGVPFTTILAWAMASVLIASYLAFHKLYR